jgi:Tfp pilus assembly protein FimT
MNLRSRLGETLGYSLIDIVITLGIIATVAGVAVPAAVNMIDAQSLNTSVRDVERELQFARLKAVTSQTRMRVRLDCPKVGQFRAVELVGTPTAPTANDMDSYTDRCKDTLFPYSPTGVDSSRLTRPNNDGPVRTLQTQVSFVGTSKAPTLYSIEFWPDGTAHNTLVNGTTVTAPLATATITLTRKGVSKNIQVNGFGKIQMDR